VSPEERGKRKEERGKRKEERGKRKEERGKQLETGREIVLEPPGAATKRRTSAREKGNWREWFGDPWKLLSVS
jgi:hypothetical protein